MASGCIREDTSRDLAYRLRQINESVTKLIEAAAVKDIPVYKYAARSVKQAVTGKGSADKQQVQKMVQPLLKLPMPWPLLFVVPTAHKTCYPGPVLMVSAGGV